MQGPLYKPLGLGCGHKFCTECVLSVVQVEGEDLLKPLRRILADVPHGTACPQCRQRAVFYNAVELKKLGAFIYATCGPSLDVSIPSCACCAVQRGVALPSLHLLICLLCGRVLFTCYEWGCYSVFSCKRRARMLDVQL